MPIRALILGRAIAGLALIALAVAMLASGPKWLMILLLAAAAVSLLVVGLAPNPRAHVSLTELFSAVDELDRLVGEEPSARLAANSSDDAIAIGTEHVRSLGAELRAVLQSLRMRDRTLTELLDAVEEPILATDADGLILLCNQAAQTLLDLRADRLVGRPVEEAFTQPEFVAVVNSAREGKPARDEIKVPRVEGPRIWETAAVPYGPASTQRAVVLSIRDVTERSLALQVKSDFVANASHELRTPVSAIRMAAETLESLGPDDHAMRGRLVGMIASHTHRLEELIRDLLDLTRLESADADIQREPVTSEALIQALTPMFEGACRDRGLTLRFDVAPEISSMRSDRNLLLLILGNLIDNSTKFAFEESEVLVTGRLGEAPGSVRFEVIDRGVGIPIHQQQRIFERFFQVDEARSGGPKRGTGLGLSIVKHAVRRLGGSIRVHSVWHRGTTMTVELPDCLAPNESVESPPLPSPAGVRRPAP